MGDQNRLYQLRSNVYRISKAKNGLSRKIHWNISLILAFVAIQATISHILTHLSLVSLHFHTTFCFVHPQKHQICKQTTQHNIMHIFIVLFVSISYLTQLLHKIMKCKVRELKAILQNKNKQKHAMIICNTLK